MAGSMLWYLLSPIRGTSRAPRFDANHPIRRAFYRHGKTTAQHWLVAMLVSVAIAMGFSYPTIFLAGDPTAGLTAYPPHFWTTAKPMDDSFPGADIEMRQIWVHGSYMKALDKDVLKHGLAIQQSLIGDDRPSNVTTSPGDELNWSTWRWGYHSALAYWNNSGQAIDADDDILRTINEQKHILSTLNIVLRPTSVFAGKRFDGQNLQAADALVISLINKVNEGPSQIWKNEMRSLMLAACQNCTLFPRDGQASRHRVYEFGFTPLSLQEHVALTFAYSCMAIYVLLSLRRMKAFHSRFGLVVTAITQMTCSILASFTICNILKINLSMVPQNAYPFVVLVIGLENMFRLINAVLAYPPTMATEIRIANALGDVGPLSVSTATHNLIILSLLSTLVSPGVAAFCVFAAIATLFDVFFLLTFFVAVLNVDIRRLELQDALVARQNHPRHRRRASPSQHPWFDALIQGRLPFSTRMAGTAVTTTFILFLNYHFFEHKATVTNIRHLFGLIRGGSSAQENLGTFRQPPMNATLTADEWMRMQDIDTAKEVLQLAKPGADTFVIRIFEPFVIVLSGSDRTEALRSREQWTQTLRTFAIHHFYPVAVAIVFVVAFVAVLMNFLLYNEAGDDENQVDLEETEDSLTVQSLRLPHKLDIIKMSTNDNGHFVTAALDRTITMVVVDPARQSYQLLPAPSKVLNSLSWPLHNMAVDDGGTWLACHGANDNVLVYCYPTDNAVNHLLDFPDDNPAILFEFVNLQSPTGIKLHLVVLTSGGRLTMTVVDQPKSGHVELSQIPLIGAAILATTGSGRRLITVTEIGQIMAFSWTDGAWTQTAQSTLQLDPLVDRILGRAEVGLYAEQGAELLLLTTPTTAIFLESMTLDHEASLSLQDLSEPGLSVDGFIVSPLRRCPSCNGIGWRKVAVYRCGSGKRSSLLTTWSTDGDEDPCICLSQSTASCHSIGALKKVKHEIKAMERCFVMTPQAVFGVRKKLSQTDGVASGNAITSSSLTLRQRKHARETTRVDPDGDRWEAYRLSIDGEMITVDLSAGSGSATNDPEKDLYVDSAGPIAALDAQAVAVVFGNTVKVIRTARRASVSRHSAVPQSERSSSTSILRDTSSRRGR